MRFTKMHGLGNDYVYIDGWREPLPQDLPALARAISDRHRGVGGDGLILVLPPEEAGHHARMRMFNADGSESGMCGNGLRCAARLAWEHGHVPAAGIRFETGAGLRTVDLHVDAAGACTGATVDMGHPILEPERIPVLVDPDLAPFIRLQPPGSAPLHLRPVGMGNPHAVHVCADVAAWDLPRIGPLLERDPVFPERAIIEFVQRLPDEDGLPVLRQRTWERGSGETQACGTGACAVCVVAILDGHIPGREAIVRLDGGDLRIAWPQDGAPVHMSGPAELVFTGTWNRATDG
ncbi:MAG: diaminopimelate epimerase [Planctomycetota bacterium]